MDRQTLHSWLGAYGRAWENRDPPAVGELFTEDATYQETPFVEPMRGRAAICEYWANKVAASQEQIQFGFEILAVHENTGIAHWWTSFVRTRTKAQVKLDGVFLLSFAPDGRCLALREWWVRQEQSSQ